MLERARCTQKTGQERELGKKHEAQIHTSVHYGISGMSEKDCYGLLTEEALYVLGAAVFGPVGVLQVPHGPFLTRQQVLDL